MFVCAGKTETHLVSSLTDAGKVTRLHANELKAYAGRNLDEELARFRDTRACKQARYGADALGGFDRWLALPSHLLGFALQR